MCPDPAVPAPTTETAIDPPPRRPGDAVRAAIADRRDYLQVTRGELLADLQRQHDALDASTSDILDIEAQLAELDQVRYAFPSPQFIPTVVDERGPERITLPAGAQVIPNNGSATMSDEQLADLAAARGLTVVDVEQHRWLQGVATRAGAMAGSRETAELALHRLFFSASDQCSDFHAACSPRVHTSLVTILDYLAGGR